MYTIRERYTWYTLTPLGPIASFAEATTAAVYLSRDYGIACHVCENDGLAIVTFDETGREVYNAYRM